jgi:vancomycin resistance protein YoaR
MGPEVVGVTASQPTEHMRKGELLETGVMVHVRSVDPSIPCRIHRQDDAPVPYPRCTPQWLKAAVLPALAAVVVLSTLLLLTWVAQAGRVLPGTSVAGVDIGGRDEWSARRLLEPILEREEQRPLAVSAPGQRLQLRPVDAGLSLDVDATVRAAIGRGRTGSWRDPVHRLTAGLVATELAPVGHVDEAALIAWVEGAAALVERDASVGDLLIDGTDGSVTIVGPRGEVRVDLEASIERVRAALLDRTTGRVDLVTTTTAPPSPRSAIEEIADRTTAALRRPLVLHHEDRRLVIAPGVLAELLTVAARPAADGITPALEVRPETLQRLIGEEASTLFSRTARDALIVTPDLPPARLTELSSTTFVPVPADIEVLPGWSRVIFIPRRLADQITTMVMEGSRSAEADLLIIDPDLPTELAITRRPTHLLGTFTTFHPAGADRTINIRLLADIIDGALVAPGEEFSINTTSGPRLCSDGFVPAGTIVRGELIDTCGGGVSQFGTTLMNAAFFSGLPLLQWQPHSFFISRYPAGREATLSYPELDVRFLNDTEGFVVVRTSYTPDSITVSIYGAPAWRSVRADHGERRSPTSFGEQVRTSPSLAPGARRVVQSGGGGFTVTVTRTRLPMTGEGSDVERWTTVYRPQQRIVEVGVASGQVNGDAERDGAAPPEADGGGNDG